MLISADKSKCSADHSVVMHNSKSSCCTTGHTRQRILSLFSCKSAETVPADPFLRKIASLIQSVITQQLDNARPTELYTSTSESQETDANGNVTIIENYILSWLIRSVPCANWTESRNKTDNGVNSLFSCTSIRLF